MAPNYHFKAWREHAGYTQRQLATLMQTSKNTISRIERGRRGCTLAFLEEFHEVIGTPCVGTVLDCPPRTGLIHRPPAFKEEEIREAAERRRLARSGPPDQNISELMKDEIHSALGENDAG